MRVRTVGHGRLPAEAFASLVTRADVTRVVDVRSYPGSRRHPHFGRDQLAEWLPEAGVAYSWEPRLGGRRKLGPGSPHVALENDAFRAYAGHMETADFAAGVDALLRLAQDEKPGAVAVMCAETLWWRCHRRLLADALMLLHGVEVEHVGHDGRLDPHRPTTGVRVASAPGRASLVYDVGVTGSLL